MHLTGLMWAAAALAGIILLAIVASRLSANARLRRRLRKARGRIVSKAPEPSVKFSVKTPKE